MRNAELDEEERARSEVSALESRARAVFPCYYTTLCGITYKYIYCAISHCSMFNRYVQA